MSDLGRRLRLTLDEVAPPADLDRIVAHEPSLPFWRVGRVLAYAAVLVAVVGITGFLLTRVGSDDTAVDSSVTTVEGTVTTVGEGEPPETDDAWTPQVLEPDVFTCSTSVEAFPCGRLFDGDPSMVWMAPNGGVGAVIQVTFDQPVEIVEVALSPPPEEEIRLRNARISEFTLVAEGRSAVHGQLTDAPGEQRFGLDGVVTTGVTITVDSAFPGVSFDGREPFVELALGEIQFLGRIAVGSPAEAPPTLDTRPLTGRWHGYTPDTEGLIAIHNDLIWDGEAFYALTRLGFGDQVVWRSSDGIEWVRHETIALAGELGLTGVYNGPTELLSVDGRLYAAGSADGRATVWVDDGSRPWRSIDLGAGGVRFLVHHDGHFVALGDSVGLSDDTDVDRHPRIWISPDGETWGEAAGDELFGSVGWTSDLVPGPAGLLTIGFVEDSRRIGNVAGVFISEDGVTWSRHDPEFLDLTQVDSIVGWDGGYAAVGVDSRVLVSSDGIAWATIGDRPEPTMPGGFTHRSGLTVLGGRLVMTGGENFVPEGADGNTTHPRVWSYAGDGQWVPVGEPEWLHSPGYVSAAVVGGDTMVIRGEADGERWTLYTFLADGGASSTEVTTPPYSTGACSAADLGSFRDQYLLDVQLLDRAAAAQETRLALIDAAIACDFEAVAAMAASDWPDNEFGWGSFWDEEGLTADRLRALDGTDHAMWDLAVALIYTEPYWEFSECEDPGTTAWYCGKEWYEWPPIRGAGSYSQEWLDRIAVLEGIPAEQLNDRLRGGHRPFGVVITTSGEWVVAHRRVAPDPVPLHLYVSNQSFDTDPVRIVVSMDGVVVIDEEFFVEGQHTWVLHDLELAPGPLEIRAVAPGTGAVLLKEVDLVEESWAVLEFWFTNQDGAAYFRLPGLLDSPPVFF